jgi:hypothetical protein
MLTPVEREQLNVTPLIINPIPSGYQIQILPDPHDAKIASDYETSLLRLLYSKSIQQRDVDTLVGIPTFSSKFWKQHLALYLRKSDMYPDA